MSSRQYRKCGAFRSTVVTTSSPRLTARLKRSARVSFLGNRTVEGEGGAREHLLRGPPREGEEKDGGWRHAGLHEPCDPVDEGAGFPPPRPRDDEQGAVPVEDRLPLPRVENAVVVDLPRPRRDFPKGIPLRQDGPVVTRHSNTGTRGGRCGRSRCPGKRSRGTRDGPGRRPRGYRRRGTDSSGSLCRRRLPGGFPTRREGGCGPKAPG